MINIKNDGTIWLRIGGIKGDDDGEDDDMVER